MKALTSLVCCSLLFVFHTTSEYIPLPFTQVHQWYGKPTLYRSGGIVPPPIRVRPLRTKQFLMTHSLHTGLDINHGKDRVVDGFLNIRNPLNPRRLWDLKGYLRTTANHIWYHYGHLYRPTNRFNLTEAAVAQLEHNPFLRYLRRMVSKQPVAVLPKQYVPLRCKPPLCNPYLHSFAFAVEYQPGTDSAFTGLLDFPIQTEDPDVELRFPLEGTVIYERVPRRVVYGQHLASFNPFRRMWRCQKCLTGIA